VFGYNLSLQQSQNYLRLNLSSDNSTSGSPHLSQLDENAATPDDRRNIRLAIDLLYCDELPRCRTSRLTLTTGKNPSSERTVTSSLYNTLTKTPSASPMIWMAKASCSRNYYSLSSTAMATPSPVPSPSSLTPNSVQIQTSKTSWAKNP